MSSCRYCKPSVRKIILHNNLSYFHNLTHFYCIFWQSFVSDYCLGDFRFEATGLMMLLFLQKDTVI